MLDHIYQFEKASKQEGLLAFVIQISCDRQYLKAVLQKHVYRVVFSSGIQLSACRGR